MRWYHKLLFVAGFFALLALFIVFGLTITTVNVEGTEHYSAEEIKQSVFSGDYMDNMLYFALYTRFNGIHKLPFVEDIEVSYEGLHTVNLRVYDKAISGCIQYMGQYVYFDRDGIVLQSMQEKREGVTVVTGISFGTFTVGEAFEVEDDSMFAMIMNLSQLITHNHIDAERIHIKEDSVLLYAGKVTVTLAKKEMYDVEFSALGSVLDTVKEQNFSGTIDMTEFEEGDRIVLKKKEPKKKKKKQKKKEADTE